MAGSDDSRSGPSGRRAARAAANPRDRRSGIDRRSAPGELPGRFESASDRRARERRGGEDPNSDAAWAPVPLDSGDTGPAGSERALHAAAVEARTRAHARFSGFAVGAALETTDGAIVSGCNIENASYGLTLCAERVALVKALSDGLGVFTRLAVVADTDAPTPPCGPCRQLLWEYCGDIDIILGNLDGPTARYRLSALLPLPFDARFLDT